MTTKSPAIITVSSSRVSCDGAGAIREVGDASSSTLGHPKIWLEIDESGEAVCGYCGQRFVKEGGAADEGHHG